MVVMDQRMVDFIRALRAAGVRISLAESQDALNGVDFVGVENPFTFKSTMKSTLVKESKDHTVFDYFFPLFFTSNHPPLQNIPENLSAQDRQLLEQAMRSIAGMGEALKALFQQLLDGKAFDDEQLKNMSERSGLEQGADMYQRAWFERRMERAANMHQLRAAMDQLLDALAEMGMSEESLQELREMMQQNADGLSQQLSQHTGQAMAEKMAHQEPQTKPDLMNVPFHRLGQNEIDQIRSEIRRLAAKLRSRASLRQKRNKDGQPDLRRTLRANMKYGGMPIELKHKTRHKKPALVVICDVSTSVRYCTEFLLTLIYELQDQVARADSFVFIADMVNVTMQFKEHDPQEAVQRVMEENRPGYYNTDLGNSLNTFKQDYYGLITHKTTVIILGDGRNNYNNPRLDIAADIQHKCRRLLWFCPEARTQWGTGDSDMHNYAAYSDGVYYVNTLNDLANAVDQILTDG
jgi:uncharacterized protein with von Willebrand factor type A (vWA) domain